MKPEPLIRKGFSYETFRKESMFQVEKEFFHISDIKSACEFFLQEIDDLYHKIGKPEVWRMNNDELVDACEDYVKEKFKLAFKDAFSGDKE